VDTSARLRLIRECSYGPPREGWVHRGRDRAGPLGVIEAIGTGYVAAGGARIWDSPDGVTWRFRLDQACQSDPPIFTVIVRGPSETLAIGTVDGVTVWLGPAEIAP
jgi:hypothetical protein